MKKATIHAILLMAIFVLGFQQMGWSVSAVVTTRPSHIDLSATTSESAVLMTLSGYTSNDARYRIYNGSNQYNCWDEATDAYISNTSYASGPQVPGTPMTSTTFWIVFQRGNNNATAGSYRDRLGPGYSANYQTAALPAATSITTPFSLTGTFTGSGGYDNTIKHVVLGYSGSTLITAASTTLSTGAFTLVCPSGTTIDKIEVRAIDNTLISSITGSWTASGSVGNIPGGTPTLGAAPSSLTGFNYVEGSGPSTSQYYVLTGSNLTPTSGDITITPTTNYDVSLNNSTFSSTAITQPYSGGAVACTVYVRLKAGLTAGNYNSELVTNAGGGATTVNVTCSGSVTSATPPTITVDPTALTGFTYVEGSGPSTSQYYLLSGSNLTPAADNITITPTTHFEVSLDNSTFSSTAITQPYSGGAVACTVYVRLKSGYANGPYNLETVSNSGGGATAQTVTCSGTVTLASTPLAAWDFSTLTGGTGNFGASPYAATEANANITVVGLTRSAGFGTLTGSGAANAWGAANYTASGTLSGEIAADKFWTFTITANSGYNVSLSQIHAYNIRRSSSGPTTGQWQYQIGTGSFVDIGTPITWGTVTTSAGNPQTAIDLSGIDDLQDVVGNTITIRLVNYGASATTGTCYWNNLANNSGHDLIVNGTVAVAGAPTLSTVPTTLTGFTYVEGSGPSTSQYYILTGTDLNPLSGDITITPTTNYDVSLDDATFSSTAITKPYTGGAVACTVYVRLKAGLTTGNYNSELVNNAGGGATAVDVTCSGTVTPLLVPAITVDPTTLTGFTYLEGAGPSASQYYLLTGSNLTPASGDLTITPTTHYEVSLDNSTFSSTAITQPYSGGAVACTVYVRLKAGYYAGQYNTETVNNSGGGATAQTVTCSGTVTTPTPLVAWDFSTLTGGAANWGPSPMTPTASNSNVTVVGLTRGSGFGTLTGTAASNAWGASNYTASGTLSGEITSNKYWTFTITPNSGYKVSLTQIQAYNIRRSSSGPPTGQWQYQIGSGSFVDIGTPITWGTVTTSAGNPQTAIDLSSITELQNVVGNTITIRLVNYGASATTGTCYWNNLANGTENDLRVLGTVEAGVDPFLSLSPSSLTGFTYAYGAGPSTSQSYYLSGGNLTPAAGDITIAGSTNYEVSTDNSSFGASKTVGYSSGTLGSTQIWVRLKAGLSGGNYNNELVGHTGGGVASPVNLTCSGSVTSTALLESTILAPFGDVAINTTSTANEFDIIGTDLSTADVTVGPLTGFTYSTTSGGTYTASLSIPQPGGSFYQTIYVKFSPTALQTYSGDIVVGGGGALSINVPASGTGILPAPVATAATSIGQNGFNANWNAVSGADGYKLDVYKIAGATTYTSDLFISEYAEGSGNNKYIEIFNGTGASVDLSNYTLKQAANGNNWDLDLSYTLPLSGTLADQDVYVIAASTANPTILAQADLQVVYSTSTQGGRIVYFTGNDAMGLFKNSSLIDVFGVPTSSATITVAGDATAGADHTIVRKASVDSPNTDWTLSSGTNATDSEWIVYAVDTWTYVGSHTYSGGPSTEYILNNVDVGNVTTYPVSGLDPNTEYHYIVRAYLGAITSPNSNTIDVTTLPGSVLVVTTQTPTAILATTATGHGTIVDIGGVNPTVRGFCWDLSSNPDPTTALATKTVENGSFPAGTFTGSITSLSPNTEYKIRAYATNTNGTAYGSSVVFTTTLAEPTNYPTDFTATGVTANTIPLTWTDATGGQLPTAYLIKGSTVSLEAIVDPVDGTPEADGGLIKNVLQGVGTHTFSGLTPSTPYYFKIYPYTNTGSAVDYKTSPPVPSVSTSTLAPPTTVYTWNQTGTASWAVSTNWTPERTTPGAYDILQFYGGGTVTVTDVPTQTIAQILISNSTVVNLQSAAAVVLTLNGSDGDDLDVPTGSALNFNGGFAIVMNLITGASASIGGNMTFSGTASVAHRLTAASASGIIFHSGAIFTAGTNFSGNAFSNVTNLSVIFEGGSTYVAQAGSNPFALTAPGSVVQFQTGSLFKQTGSITPSFSGRTYANYELDVVGGNISPTGSNAATFDNFTITNGTLNFTLTGPSTGAHRIKGDITLAPGTKLNFNPASPGTVSLSGTALQTISGGGQFIARVNSIIEINNSAGVSLATTDTIFGQIKLTSGILTVGSNNLNMGTAATFTGTPSAAAMVALTDLGTIRKFYSATGSFTFQYGTVGATTDYSPVTVDLTTGTLDPVSYIESRVWGSPIGGGASSYIKRYWSLASSGITSYTCNAQFNYVLTDIEGTESDIYCVRTEPEPATVFDPANTTLHQLTATGLTELGTFTGRSTSSNKTLNLTSLLLEGLYAGSGTMNQAMGDGFVPQWPAGVADHITVELHNAADYSIIETTKLDIELSTTGAATVQIEGTFNSSYYITIKHRNGIETTTASPVDFSGSIIDYAFDAQAKAYGNNLGVMIDSFTVIYSGDPNQDGIVDGSDLNDIGNQNDIFATGYLDEDINGDGLIDGTDLNITGNNNDAFIAKITP